MSVRLPIGCDDFAELRDSNFYYADKTEFIRELLGKSFKALLLTRPRRFGKTLTMSMLEDFFDISRDSRARFAGLKIAGETALCETWMNQWPVLFLTLKNVEGNDFGTAYERLRILLAELCRKHAYLAKSDQVDASDLSDFAELREGKASLARTTNALFLLTRMLAAHYGRPVILLIDEYDVPLAKASEAGYYKEMLDVVRLLLGTALKANEYLKFAVMTGCLRIAKESIFTGIKNFVTDTITGDRFDEYIGFTQGDVHRLLVDTELIGHSEEIRRWYDGYRFGTVDVYCPWDVLNHVSALQDNPERKPQNYWGNTSHNGIIYSFISRGDLQVNDKFEVLIAGGHIVETITEDLTYDTLHSSEQNLWSLLFLTGYLTSEDPHEAEETPGEGQIVLRIPNEEVKSLFKTAIVDWFQESIKSEDRSRLFCAMWEGRPKEAQEYISDLLFETISYHDYKESYYHAFLAGLFAGAGYIVESNYEHGTGRPDVVVKDKRNRRALVLEAKHARTEAELDAKCQEAVSQIRARKYMEGVEKGYRVRLGYGLAFYEKECRVEKIE